MQRGLMLEWQKSSARSKPSPLIPQTQAQTVHPDQVPGADRGFLSIILPLLLTALAILALTLASIWLLSSLRAYAYAEGLYSKAERQAVADLVQYGVSGSEQAWLDLRRQLDVLAWARAARVALQLPEPDGDIARRDLLKAGNHAADVGNMVRLFRMAHALPQMAHAVDLWTRGDAEVVRMEEIAGQLHELVDVGAPDARQVEDLLARVRFLHARLVPMEADFAVTVNDVSRQAAWLLVVVTVLSSAALLVVAIAVSRANLRRSERVAGAYAARLSHQATHDALTGLRNRVEFEGRLREAIDERSRGIPFVLMYFDLDQFKVVNDTCGHAAGDELIKQVAWLARERMRDGDVLARLGGDEFGALVRNCSPEHGLQLAERIRQEVADLRFHWKDRMFAVSASIGVASLGETLPSVEEALAAVDQACYLAKENGRNRVQFYLPDDQQVQAMRGDMRWVERLHAALDGGDFLLMAQEIRPIGLRAGQGNLVAPHRRFELLLRMLDADGRPAPPMGFIPAAERYGLMPRIDRWVIARACRELAGLRTRGHDLPTCMINLSGTSVSDPGLADYIAACLAEHGISGAYMGFELTETAAIGNLGNAAQLFARLRELGCPIALDDFGSGMASFAYLKTLPIDFVKIDGGFIRDIRDDPVDFALVEAVQRIGDVLGFKTVAEWVENQEVLDALTRIGIDFAQGFHIHRPVPMACITEPADGGV